MKYFSIIIAYYKNEAALQLILKALSVQSYCHFEIIIAEDDVQSAFLWLQDLNLQLKLKHVYQDKDDGFRKNQILNKAVLASEGSHLIFIDGDCIPHPHFVKAYARFLTEDCICFGRRVMVGPELTAALLKTLDLKLLSFKNLLFSSSKRLKYMLYLPFARQSRNTGIWGHNWGVAKHQLVAVNGFDEDYQTAGVGEDVDIEWRLMANGLHLYSIRFAAIQFHLHHTENYSPSAIQTGRKLMEQKQKDGLIVCKNGLVKF